MSQYNLVTYRAILKVIGLCLMAVLFAFSTESSFAQNNKKNATQASKQTATHTPKQKPKPAAKTNILSSTDPISQRVQEVISGCIADQFEVITKYLDAKTMVIDLSDTQRDDTLENARIKKIFVTSEPAGIIVNILSANRIVSDDMRGNLIGEELRLASSSGGIISVENLLDEYPGSKFSGVASWNPITLLKEEKTRGLAERIFTDKQLSKVTYIRVLSEVEALDEYGNEKTLSYSQFSMSRAVCKNIKNWENIDISRLIFMEYWIASSTFKIQPYFKDLKGFNFSGKSFSGTWSNKSKTQVGRLSFSVNKKDSNNVEGYIIGDDGTQYRMRGSINTDGQLTCNYGGDDVTEYGYFPCMKVTLLTYGSEITGHVRFEDQITNANVDRMKTNSSKSTILGTVKLSISKSQ